MARGLPKPSNEDITAVLGKPGEPADKTARINFLVSQAERLEIQETAKAFGLTTTDYLLRLHRLTRSMVDSQKRPRSKVSQGARRGGNRGQN